MQDGNHKNDTNMKRTIITLLCTMCLLSNYIAAQTQRMKVISGIVRAEDGNPLSGVLVSTPDKMVFSAISNKDGQILMKIPESENTIICKSIGYKDENITLVSGKSIDIVLQTDFTQQDVELETALLQKSRNIAIGFGKVTKSYMKVICFRIDS